jgi:N-acetylglucosaminyl-diphospho-decaprenol L-rhamnosyltransferase
MVVGNDLCQKCPLVTVIIVTHQSAHCLKAQSSLLAQFANVMIVDNASQDGIAEAVRLHLPNAQLITLPSNMGFGYANNVALQKVQTPFALLLNPDCTMEQQAVSALLDAADKFPEAALLAPQVKRPGGQLETSYRWPSRCWVSRGQAADGTCCVGFVTGACMLLRMHMYAQTGFFDEGFFLYYEDEDLCERVFRTKANIIVVPQATAIHVSRSSVKEGFPWRSEYIRGFHHAQSKLIFQAKHGDASRIQWLRMRVLLLALLGVPLRMLWPQPRYLVRLLGRIAGLLRYRRRDKHDA